ncbi:hypothetical protein BASA81_001486 [Batrachochytrium salamandrivorans]|nr:hypothetical protein BASA81_001486 [Batrachochytrium salamandrivorans]
MERRGAPEIGSRSGRVWHFVHPGLEEHSTRRGHGSLKQIKERFRLKLDEAFTSTDWTKEEDDLLLAAVGRYGHRWAIISRELAGRNENAAKTRFHVLRRKEDKVWTAEEDELLQCLLAGQPPSQSVCHIAHHFPRKTSNMVAARKDLFVLQETADSIKRKMEADKAVASPVVPPPTQHYRYHYHSYNNNAYSPLLSSPVNQLSSLDDSIMAALHSTTGGSHLTPVSNPLANSSRESPMKRMRTLWFTD